MGFRGPLAFIILTAATLPCTLALAAPPAKTASKPAAASTSAPASSANAAKTPQAEFAALKAVPTKPGDPKAGKTKAVACGACHGATGNSTVAQYPKLAAQNERYIVTQLMRFKSGLRKNAIMHAMAAPLSPQDMHDIGAYYAMQKRTPGVADTKLVKLGKTIFHQGDASLGIPSCAACHGPAGNGNPGWRVPNIGGQHTAYIKEQLQAWHDGASWGSDPHAQIMPTIAKRLTEKDIAAVSSYVEGLHSAPPPKKPTAPNIID